MQCFEVYLPRLKIPKISIRLSVAGWPQFHEQITSNMEQLTQLLASHPVAAAAAGAGILLLMGLALAYRRTLEVEEKENLVRDVDVCKGSNTMFRPIEYNYLHVFAIFVLLRSLQAFARDLHKLTALASAAPRSAPLTALITGANSGIGFTLAVHLARSGLRVILGCRSASRGQAAVDRIKSMVGAAADVRLLIVDVSDPVSVVRAAEKCRSDASLGITHGLNYLFLNAGIMPLSRYRWEVAVQAFLIGGLGYFLTTGRAHAGSAHFLGQPQDELGACGAPATFATNVLGHLLLVEELLPLLSGGALTSAACESSGSSKNSNNNRKAGAARSPGCVVWTGSRAATAARFAWEHLSPPTEANGRISGHEALLKIGRRILGEGYGESKYATDLLNVSWGGTAIFDCVLSVFSSDRFQ